MVVPQVWHWSADRYRLAKYVSEGDTYREAGRKVGLAEVTVQGYMNRVPEFRAYVDKITLENELASRGGTVRMLLRQVKEKEAVAGSDKSTFLDNLKFLREVMKEDDDHNDNEFTVTFK